MNVHFHNSSSKYKQLTVRKSGQKSAADHLKAANGASIPLRGNSELQHRRHREDLCVFDVVFTLKPSVRKKKTLINRLASGLHSRTKDQTGVSMFTQARANKLIHREIAIEFCPRGKFSPLSLDLHETMRENSATMFVHMIAAVALAGWDFHAISGGELMFSLRRWIFLDLFHFLSLSRGKSEARAALDVQH